MYFTPPTLILGLFFIFIFLQKISSVTPATHFQNSISPPPPPPPQILLSRNHTTDPSILTRYLPLKPNLAVFSGWHISVPHICLVLTQFGVNTIYISSVAETELTNSWQILMKILSNSR